MNRIHVFEDDWSGVKSNNKEYFSDSLDQISDSIRRLNGKNRTSVVLVSGENSLTVSGGNAGRYIVFVNIGNDAEIYTLMNREDPPESGKLEVVAGGQSGMVDAKACVTLGNAQEAVSFFVQNGVINPKLLWTQEI